MGGEAVERTVHVHSHAGHTSCRFPSPPPTTNTSKLQLLDREGATEREGERERVEASANGTTPCGMATPNWTTCGRFENQLFNQPNTKRNQNKTKTPLIVQCWRWAQQDIQINSSSNNNNNNSKREQQNIIKKKKTLFIVNRMISKLVHSYYKICIEPLIKCKQGTIFMMYTAQTFHTVRAR